MRSINGFAGLALQLFEFGLFRRCQGRTDLFVDEFGAALVHTSPFRCPRHGQPLTATGTFFDDSGTGANIPWWSGFTTFQTNLGPGFTVTGAIVNAGPSLFYYQVSM
jgi:hypothetical protein